MKNIDLEKKIKELPTLSENTIDNNKIKELQDEIKLFRKYYSFSPEEKLISIKIVSVDQQIDFDVIAKTTDTFTKIEGDLYNKYEKYKFTENYFLVNGIKIKKHLNLQENNIKSRDILILNVTDE